MGMRPERATGMRLLTGAQAAAEALRQIDPDVMAVYPITPQTPIVETFAAYVADGRVHTELVRVESEHSAMSAAVGAALAGARSVTATASQGLAYMIEVLYVAAALRAPVVTALGNRALSAPINIHADHSDAMLARDTGAVILFAENAQEVYDLMLMAPRVAEHPEVMLPVLVGQDGFTITHSAEPVALLADDAVRAFVGPYRVPMPLLDTAWPVTVGAFAMPDSYFEFRHQLVQATERALVIHERVARAYGALTGRYLEAVESYRMDGAERVVVLMGSAAGTAKDVVDRLRARGEAVGLLKLRLFRPFPGALVARRLKAGQRVAVVDRAVAPGAMPPLYSDLAACLGGRVRLKSYVAGLGGRDITPEDVEQALADVDRPGPPVTYLGLGRGTVAF
jgi:pyruvate ferredoxin oxidoreductase alpha subunit